MRRAALPRLHAITDERIARRPDVGDIAQQLAVVGGADLALHARGRLLSGLEHVELANRLSAYPPSRLFVNDRLDVALAAGAAGVQLGHSSLDVDEARRLDAGWWIGKSVHDLPEAEAAHASGADYLVVGPVFPTPTHPDREPLGAERLGAIARLGIPTIAIGGVTPERISAVRNAGAHGIAAIRALWDAADPTRAAGRMLEELNK
ncbi:MAG TPA: thiamine phosphate synthase [Gemmatimonadales bacterium]|nr:thiamine phosphate synthase [Gemmatimonadales bacterium]